MQYLAHEEVFTKTENRFFREDTKFRQRIYEQKQQISKEQENEKVSEMLTDLREKDKELKEFDKLKLKTLKLEQDIQDAKNEHDIHITEKSNMIISLEEKLTKYEEINRHLDQRLKDEIEKRETLNDQNLQLRVKYGQKDSEMAEMNAKVAEMRQVHEKNKILEKALVKEELITEESKLEISKMVEELKTLTNNNFYLTNQLEN